MTREMSSLMTVQEVAEMLRVSSVWVYQHANGTRRPKIPSVRLGASVRFRREAIEQWVQAQERSA